MKINFFSTTVNKTVNKKLEQLFKKNFISSGKASDEFEKKFEKIFGLKNCTAVNSGTSSLHLALTCAKIKKGDEVILSPQTFIASALAILYVGAKPVFADIQQTTGNICPNSILKKITLKTKAIMCIHWGGYPCDMSEINKIAKRHKLLVIEDAAHALGAIYKKKKIGSISDFTCFSFQAKKHLTTGDGGMLVCKKAKDYRLAQKLKWFGIDRNSQSSFLGERIYDISQIGFKYHLNDIASTIGIENLKIINKKINYLKHVAKFYDKNLLGIKSIKILDRNKDRISTSWLYTILVKDRNKFFYIMKKNNIPVSIVHRRIDKYKIFGGVTKNLSNQEYFDKHHICLPIHEQLTKFNLIKIVKVIRENF
jgi:perosamine synthetase